MIFINNQDTAIPAPISSLWNNGNNNSVSVIDSQPFRLDPNNTTGVGIPPLKRFRASTNDSESEPQITFPFASVTPQDNSITITSRSLSGKRSREDFGSQQEFEEQIRKNFKARTSRYKNSNVFTPEDVSEYYEREHRSLSVPEDELKRSVADLLLDFKIFENYGKNLLTAYSSFLQDYTAPTPSIRRSQKCAEETEKFFKIVKNLYFLTILLRPEKDRNFTLNNFRKDSSICFKGENLDSLICKLTAHNILKNITQQDLEELKNTLDLLPGDTEFLKFLENKPEFSELRQQLKHANKNAINEDISIFLENYVFPVSTENTDNLPCTFLLERK